MHVLHKVHVTACGLMHICKLTPSFVCKEFHQQALPHKNREAKPTT